MPRSRIAVRYGALPIGGGAKVNWNKARDVIAFLGVAGPLIFVGYEIRQNTAATTGQTRQELAAINQEWLILLTADPEFSDLFHRAWELGEEIDPSEEYRAEMMMVLNVRRLENVFFQYQAGLVDQSALASYGLASLRMESPRLVEWWVQKDWRSAFHPDFVRFVENRQDRAP